ncbi:hypothetical protein C8R46DRAFT_1197630 [Mycena filopes]|nr:hypothetical protein C8R46DRAFT_1197630 [Mycena filopes]
MPSFRALGLFLLAVVLTVLANANETRPGTMRPKLQPQRKSNLLLATNARRDTSLIAGLLVARACSSGYGLCGNGGCCPVGGCPHWGVVLRHRMGAIRKDAVTPGRTAAVVRCSSCTEAVAVRQGTRPVTSNNTLLNGGLSSYCDVVDGVQGCCPTGKCDISGYVPCTNDDFCCHVSIFEVPGETCYRDASGNPGCRSGGGGGGSPTTKTTTTTHTPSTTGNAGGTPTGSAAQNVTIDVSSLETGGIAWVGDWVLVPSSCTPGKMARAVSGNGTIVGDGANSSAAYFFAGTAIYLSVASRNVQYVVTIDGEDTTSYGVNNSATPANCTFGWSRTGLSAIGEHFLQISIVGPAASDSDSDTRVLSQDLKKASTDPWMLEMQNLVITQGGSSAGGGTVSGSSATSTSKSGGDSGGDTDVGAASAVNVPSRLLVLLLFGLYFIM